MAKLKQGDAKEKAGAATAAAAAGDFDSLSSAQLRTLLTDRGIDVRDCFERADLLQRARDRLGT